MTTVATSDSRLLLLAECNRMDHEEDILLTLTYGSSPVNLQLGKIDREAVSIFRHGYCSYIALALHELTGLPMAIFTIPDAPADGWSGHMALQVDEDEYLDIAGIYTEEEINDYYWYGESFNSPLMNKTIAHNGEEAKFVFDPSLHDDVWGFIDELEELVVRDFARILFETYLKGK